MIFQKEKVNNVIISILLVFAVCLYYWGYDICHYFYNQYDYEAGSKLRKITARKFWELRFSNYSVIIAIILYTQRFKLNKFNKIISKIGFNLAFISAIDKLIFKDFDFSKFDIYIFSILIVWEILINLKEILINLKFIINELHKRVSKK